MSHTRILTMALILLTGFSFCAELNENNKTKTSSSEKPNDTDTTDPDKEPEPDPDKEPEVTETDGPDVAINTITLNNQSETGVTLNWNKATDEETAQTELQYYVYYSNTDNLSSITEVESNGTLFGGPITDSDHVTVTGLEATAALPDFYFNVLVKDEDDKKSIYQTVKTLDLEISSTETGFGVAETLAANFKDNYSTQCTGNNDFPALDWENLPLGTKSLVLIVDDQFGFEPADGDFVHLTLYNMSVVDGIPRVNGFGGTPNLSPYGSVTNNSWNGGPNPHSSGWAGPCPPSGTHTYYFRIFALSDASITVTDKHNRYQFMQNYADKVISYAEISAQTN